MRGAVPILVLAACGDEGALVHDPHVIVDGQGSTTTDCRTGICAHNENTDLIAYQGAIYLVHRTAESQVLGPNSSLRISRTTDAGAHWELLAVLPAIDGRDLRDPHFYVIDGKLAITALTRLPITSDRDSFVDTIAVGTQSADGGATWTPLAPIGPVTWSFWRIVDHDGLHYNAAYEDGDKSVRLFSSADGLSWTQGPVIWDHAEDTPLETELVFAPSGMLLALVRMDGTNEELYGNVGRLRTKVCWSPPPYTAFDCPQDLDGVRLDGPLAFVHDDHLLVVARKHILGVEDKKRTALYEIRGPLDGSPISIVEHAILPSAGDTAYAGVAPIDDAHVLVTWYSSSLVQDSPWVRAILGPTDIWQATLDLSEL